LGGSFDYDFTQSQCGENGKQPTTTTKEQLQNNWSRLLNNSTIIQSVENNQTREVI
jgi:hypothetical protein